MKKERDTVSSLESETGERAPRILLRNAWQTVNIGDIGHAPGALSLIGHHFPAAKMTLWPNSLEHGARELLAAGYPALKIAEGELDVDHVPATPALARAWEEADLYLNGSGSNFPAHRHAAAFHRRTGKPVGVFAVSVDPICGFGEGRDPEGGKLEELRARALALPSGHLRGDLRYAIDHAAFMFCRDTISRDYLRSQGVKAGLLEFGPDTQLGMHLRDDVRGARYLRKHGLEEGKFICVVPRLRYTPYHHMGKTTPVPDDAVRDAINERTVESDHAKLREMIILYVRATGNKVLACPEMTYQIPLAKEILVDPLPADIRDKVVWRDTYWLPDEAASVYARAEAVISIECHSPLIALHQGTPAIHVRQPTDTCKGQMYRDIGSGEWFFEIDETSGPELWTCLEKIHRDPAGSRAKVKTIMGGVQNLQRRMVGVLEATVASGRSMC